MTRIGALRIGVVVLAIGVGVFLVLLAQDVRSWQATLSTESLRTIQHPATAAPLTPSTMLPDSVSEDLLAAGRDRNWLSAIQKFAAAYQGTENLDGLGPGAYILLDHGETALTKLTQDPNPVRASQAYDLLAVLVFRQAYPGSGVDPGLVGDALIDLENAVRLDPQNEIAKENLELALRVAVAVHATAKKGASSGNAANGKRQGGQGAPAGVGY